LASLGNLDSAATQDHTNSLSSNANIASHFPILCLKISWIIWTMNGGHLDSLKIKYIPDFWYSLLNLKDSLDETNFGKRSDFMTKLHQ